MQVQVRLDQILNDTYIAFLLVHPTFKLFSRQFPANAAIYWLKIAHAALNEIISFLLHVVVVVIVKEAFQRF